MKKIGIVIALLAVSLFFFVGKSDSKLQPYYSGDAVDFNNKVVFATANSGKIEIFKSENRTITKTLEITNYNNIFNINDSYSDLKLSIENGKLYVYAVSQYTLFKYNISDLYSAQLEKRVSNNYWEWYQRVDRFGSNIATVSEKGIKIYNSDLQVIDAYNFSAENPYSIRSNASQQYLFAVDNDNIRVYDRLSRTVVREIPLAFAYKSNNHRVYFDSVNNEIYAIDDTYTKKFDFNGNLLASFRHLEYPGYEVDSTYGNPFIYFSNGTGVVKMNKDNFSVSSFAYTSMIGGPQGWAMGLKVVNTDKGDVVVVFNGSNIVLLDKNLKEIDSIKSNTYSASVSSNENLSLNLSSYWVLANAPLTISGTGFWSSEPLLIKFGNAGFDAKADNSGRFTKEIVVPNMLPGRYDIKVTGVNSALTYSSSIEVK